MSVDSSSKNYLLQGIVVRRPGQMTMSVDWLSHDDPLQKLWFDTVYHPWANQWMLTWWEPKKSYNFLPCEGKSLCCNVVSRYWRSKNDLLQRIVMRRLVNWLSSKNDCPKSLCDDYSSDYVRWLIVQKQSMAKDRYLTTNHWLCQLTNRPKTIFCNGSFSKKKSDLTPFIIHDLTNGC